MVVWVNVYQVNVFWVLYGDVDGVDVPGSDFQVVAAVSAAGSALCCASRRTVQSGDAQAVNVRRSNMRHWGQQPALSQGSPCVSE